MTRSRNVTKSARFSIAMMMGVIVVAALLSALVVFTIRLDVGPVRVVSGMLLALSVLAVIRVRGRARAFAIGCAILG